ncbi:hypothetical protein CL622_04110 [archaeon]|nr:hypothetical protein [archaeon]
MKIKNEFIGSKVFKKPHGTFTIEEGKEELYTKLELDIFEDEPNKTKKGRGNGKRSTDPDGKNDDK